MGLLESLIAQRQGLKIKLFPLIPLHGRMCAFVRVYACVCLNTSLKLVRVGKCSLLRLKLMESNAGHI